MGQGLLLVVAEAGVKWAGRLRLAQAVIVSVQSAATKNLILLDNLVVQRLVPSVEQE